MTTLLIKFNTFFWVNLFELGWVGSENMLCFWISAVALFELKTRL